MNEEEAEGDDEGADEEEADEEAEASEGAPKRKREDGPVQLGFKSFDVGAAAVHYFRELLSSAPQDVDLNEVSAHNL